MNISKILKRIKPYNTLGMKLTGCDDESVSFGISLADNLNDKNTMFAGSIYSALVLCAWTIAYKTINKDAVLYDVVIKNSSIEYLVPVRTDAVVKACIKDEPVLKSDWKAVVTIEARLFDDNGKLCAVFSGNYVCIRK